MNSCFFPGIYNFYYWGVIIHQSKNQANPKKPDGIIKFCLIAWARVVPLNYFVLEPRYQAGSFVNSQPYVFENVSLLL